MKHPLATLAQIVSLNAQAVMARIHIAEAHMRAVAADGYPGGGEGGDGHLTPTEAAVQARWTVERDHAELLNTLQRAADLTNRVINVCDRYPGVGHDHAAEVKLTRCDGEMDPTCEDNAVVKGKCMRCYQRARRRSA